MRTSQTTENAKPPRMSVGVKKRMLKSAWHNEMLGALMDNCPAILKATFGSDRAPLLKGRAEVALKRYVQTLPARVERLSKEWRQKVEQEDPDHLAQVARALKGLAAQIVQVRKQKVVIPNLPIEITDQKVMVPIQQTLDGRGRVRPNPLTVDYFDFEASVTMAIGIKYKSDLDWLVEKHGATLEMLRDESTRGEHVLQQVAKLDLKPELEVVKGSATFAFVLVPPTFSLGETVTRLSELHAAKERECADVATRHEDLIDPWSKDQLGFDRWRIILVAEDEKQLQAASLSGFSWLNATLLGRGSVPSIEMTRPATDAPRADSDDE